MCLIVIAWKTHPKYPLVVLANRDEFYERLSKPLHWWDDYPNILAGRDMADVIGNAGTWCGINRNGKFATLTNIRSPSEKNPSLRSRGELVFSYLNSSQPTLDHLKQQTTLLNRYNGFNLITADLSSKQPHLYWVSNRSLVQGQIKPNSSIAPQALEPGIYGVSNAFLDTPWPKVSQTVGIFAQTLAKDTGDFKGQDTYLKIMANTKQAADEELPNTGVSREWEKILSSPFIATENYGTRATTLLRIHESGEYQMFERSFSRTQKYNDACFSGFLEPNAPM